MARRGRGRTRSRGGGGGAPLKGKRKILAQRAEGCRERMRLEERWFSRIERTPDFARAVVHADAQSEPLHRWLGYRQGFSPDLVRSVLASADLARGALLDPFSGSGTTVLESARQGRPALGVEALESLAFLTAVRLRPERRVRPFELACPALADYAEAARDDLQRAAVLMAASRTVKGDGSPRRDLPPPEELLAQMIDLIRADADVPLAAPGAVLCGDSRRLPLAGDSVGGVLTSPPYLSRYDYTRVTRPMEELYARGPHALEASRRRQVRAHGRAHARDWSAPAPLAGAEAMEELRAAGQGKLAGVVRSYFEDMAQVLGECARVLRPGAPLVLVVAGARLKQVYVPADLCLAEICEGAGLEVEELLETRTFGPGRRLGAIDGVAPREMVLSARKP